MGFRENVEALLSRSHWSQHELAAAGISSGRVSRILSNPTSPTLATVTRIAAADMVRGERLPAPGDELELILQHQGELSAQDIQAVHAFLAYLREARAKGNRHGR